MCSIAFILVWTLTFIRFGVGQLQFPFTKSRIVPDLLPVIPKGFLFVKYKTKVIDLGTELEPNELTDAPAVKWNPVDDTLYTLALVDADWPTNNKSLTREFLHWMVGNIVGIDLRTGDVVADYIPPRPKRGSGLHRYVFLLFKQANRMNFSGEPVRTYTSYLNRDNFSITHFAYKYSLDVPVAGNFFFSRFNSSERTTYRV